MSKHRIAAIICLVVVFLIGSTSTVVTAQRSRPNVIIVMPDDISYGSLAYYAGKGAPRTPHLDSLARSSVRLTDFHVSPTCSPTRAALMTGRHNNATGVWHTYIGRALLRGDEVTMADVFKANGYTTGLFGKWHLGENYPFRPKDCGFEYVARHRGGGVGQAKDYWGNSNHPPSKYWVNDRLVPLTDEDDGIKGALSTNFFFGRAMEFMAQAIEQDRPFFAYLPLNAAHGPIDAHPPDARPGVDWKTAMVENIDRNMGRLLSFLEKRGIAKNTIVIYTTDNGGSARAYKRFRGGKSSHYDGGHRVPCLVRWPGENLGGAKGRDVDSLTAHIDWLPTFMDLLDLDDVNNRSSAVPIHGMSIASLLDQDPTNDLPQLSNRAIVIDNQRVEHLTKFKDCSVMRDEVDATGRIVQKWRMVRANARAKTELYDVLNDPRQAKNLASNKSHSKVLAQLRRDYEQWWQIVSARADEYVRPILGHADDPDACLWGFDWHDAQGPWSQRLIATGAPSNGVHAVRFAGAGTYRFELRRWPREIADQTTITSAAPKLVSTNTPCKALPIAQARIKVYTESRVFADQTLDVLTDADSIVFSLPELPVGDAFIKTWFIDDAGKEICGAYYVYVTRNK